MDKQIKLFLEFLKNEKRLSDNTLQSYNRDIQQYKLFLEMNRLNYLKIENDELQEYIDGLKEFGKKPATVSRNLATLRSFYSFLMRTKKIKDDPTFNVQAPRVEKKTPSVLTSDEVNLLLEQPKDVDLKGTRDKAMLEVAYATGMKVTEIIDLNIEDFNAEQGIITIKNRKSTRDVPLGGMAIAALTEYINDARPILLKDENNRALFINMNGSRLTRQGFWKIVKYYKEKAHIEKDITPHVLRHSFASHLLQNGADMKSIQTMLGHSDISSTKVYASFENAEIRDVYKHTFPRA